MKRPLAPVKSAKGKPVCPDLKFAGLYPTLTGYLLDGWWDDGKARECSSLSVKMDSSSVSISLCDHALQCSAYTTAGSFLEAMSLLEAALLNESVQWRPWKRGK
jgi:hypothetical protein